MEIIQKALGELTPYENNPRRIGEDAVNAVAESIREFGFRNPIVIDAHGVIVCGHTRYQAAQSLGLASVPCVVADDLTEEQIKAYRLVDNRTSEFSAWDFSALEAELDALSGAFDMSAFGFDLDAAFSDTPDFDGAEPAEGGYAESQSVEDEYSEEPPEQPKAKRGDIYQLGRHRLMCGDATNEADVHKLMGDSIADMLLTDPPYNVNYDEKEKSLAKVIPNARVLAGKNVGIPNDNMDDDAFRAFLKSAFKNADAVMKSGGGVLYLARRFARLEFQAIVRRNRVANSPVLSVGQEPCFAIKAGLPLEA